MELTHRGAGLPVWGIVPRLREVDATMTPALQGRIMEFHPELAWKRLAGRVLLSKHTAAGLVQRLGLLRPHVPNLDEMDGGARTSGAAHAGLDDVLDALVGLAVAASIRTQRCQAYRLPESEPQRDERGLRMEIWY
jgi:predicted RNase H-like nuclease